MFQTLGSAVPRIWPLLLVGWFLILVGLDAVAPEWKGVIRDGEFRYLPADVPSRRGEELFRIAFSKNQLGSSVVLVVRRESGEDGLTEEDRLFIDERLKPSLEKIAAEEVRVSSGSDAKAGEANNPASLAETDPAERSNQNNGNKQTPIISRIRTYSDPYLGLLLESDDKKASLVIIQLTSEFREYRNQATVGKIEKLIDDLRRHPRKDHRIPPGLDVALSGSATVGRDMRVAAKESASATETITILLVIALLITIYRAPILAFIPLMTVYVSVNISLKILALLADAQIIRLFHGIEVYVTVVLYGAGVDYCVFLMARYKEELDAGATFEEAISNAVAKVGAALAASAGTTMCGIGMMVFAQFGKFQQAGIAMSLSLFFVLCAALTFAPSLLRLAGPWAFWPHIRTERITAGQGWLSPTSLVARLMEKDWFRGVWDKIGQALLARPGRIWLASVAVMAPFAAFGIINFNFLSYGLLSELSADNPSVVGAEAVQTHFPGGETGPVTILLKNQNFDFLTNEAIAVVDELQQRLEARKEELGISDIRSVKHPLGITGRAVRAAASEEQRLQKVSFPQRAIESKKRQERVLKRYVSDTGTLKGHVTRIDVVFANDPFSRDSIEQLDRLKETMASILPDQLSGGTELLYFGSTPSIRDLKMITHGDQIRINFLVIIGVFLVLVILLRRPAISGYLILSVFFSYLVTLGVTFAVFWMLDPSGFSGLDWKVPMFLFTILIAVGEDYNIYLITRIDEEQVRHGPVEGVTIALSKTGSIISSCGFIMAGTFSSLMAGSLVGMNQLGFALAFGVLLDTFVVRPILVPAYLILLHRGHFGGFGKWLGAQERLPTETAPTVKIGADGRDQQDP